MVDWERVERDLADAGYQDFEFETGETAVPGLSGSWLAGNIERDGRLRRANLPYTWKLLDALPFGAAVPTDPEFAPERVRQIADEHGLEVIIVSAGSGRVRIAVADPN